MHNFDQPNCKGKYTAIFFLKAEVCTTRIFHTQVFQNTYNTPTKGASLKSA